MSDKSADSLAKIVQPHVDSFDWAIDPKHGLKELVRVILIYYAAFFLIFLANLKPLDFKR